MLAPASLPDQRTRALRVINGKSVQSFTLPPPLSLFLFFFFLNQNRKHKALCFMFPTWGAGACSSFFLLPYGSFEPKLFKALNDLNLCETEHSQRTSTQGSPAGTNNQEKYFSVSSHQEQGRTKQVQVNPRPLQSRTVGRSPKDFPPSRTLSSDFADRLTLNHLKTRNYLDSTLSGCFGDAKAQMMSKFQGSSWLGGEQTENPTSSAD